MALPFDLGGKLSSSPALAGAVSLTVTVPSVPIATPRGLCSLVEGPVIFLMGETFPLLAGENSSIAAAELPQFVNQIFLEASTATAQGNAIPVFEPPIVASG